MAVARALFEPEATDAQLAALGATREDFGETEIEVFPENWPAFELFDALRTQWRVGFGVRTGLDYNVLFRKLDRMGLAPEAYDAMESDIRVMERAVLEGVDG